MKDTNKLNPEIRFSGFTDDWEQRKLGEILKYEQPSLYIVDNTDYDDSFLTPVLTAGQSFILGYTNETEGIKYASKENPVIIFDDFTTSSHLVDFPFKVKSSAMKLLSLRKNEDDIYFMVNTLKNIKYIPASHERHWISIFSEFNIPIPCNNVEQQKIGEYFSNLDHLITLHQRKLDKLKTLKKAMLEKMFPKNGESVPEIRFSGFTDDWEQRKVTELGEIYIGLVTTMTSHYTDHGALLIRNSDIKDGRFEFGDNPIYLDDEFAKQNASRKHRVGDVITVHTGDIGTSAVITEKEAGSIGFATIVTRPNQDKITSEYLCTYLNTDTHKNFAMNISTGDGRNNYNLKDYYECIVPFPSTAEQKKISDFIGRVSTLITLHQRKLDKLKTLKKAMLEKMFI
ncbi:restriction endonuclease subunit S [Streptococcus infantarius]|uniref:restriction endonuclease subunit S n=2 Tax=Streptococcus infantarius TaxID=102684 RepID=UPI0022E0F35A|nr:restriction endonuclease subunit S [Streptococcus infantarius]